MKKVILICMSFDGEYKTEDHDFKSVDEAWDYCNDMGSRWYFYPFCFVVSASKKTILDAPDRFYWTIRKRVNTIQRIFKDMSERRDMQEADVEMFADQLYKEREK